MRPALPAIAALLALTAACSTHEPTPAPSRSSSASSSPASPATVTLMPNAPAPHAAAPDARTGGVLTVEYSGEPMSLDPSAAYSQDAERILHLTHRSLTAFTVVDGRSVLVPDLATDLGRPSADGLTWTFTLRPGLRYSDGSPVRAADVVHAVKRSFAHRELPGGPTYQDEYLAGGHDYRGPWSSPDASFKAAEAPDERTVVLHLAQKMPALPYLASFSQLSPIPAAADTRPDHAAPALATGPYQVERYTPGTELVLRRNPHWDPATDPARTAHVDGYRIRFGVEDAVSQRGVLASTGSYATTLNWDPIDPSLAGEVRGARRDRFVTGPGTCTVVVNLDARRLPLAVRRAVAAAYPFDQAAAAAGYTDLTADRSGSLLPPQVPGRLAAGTPGVPAGRGTGDPAAARRILSEAGKLGFELVWYQGDDPDSARPSLVVADAMRAAGFRVRTLSVPAGRLEEVRSDPQGPHNIFASPAGWCYDWPSGDAVYRPTLSSSALRAGRSSWGSLADPAVDAEIARISALPLDQAAAQWPAFEKWLMSTRLPVLPSHHDRATVVHGAKVHGVVIDPAKGMPALDAVWVED